jgi:hypothetical protein
MPIFHFNIASIKRSTGQQATGAAAYRAGEVIRDERTGTVHNYSKRQDVRHKEILLPSRFGQAPMEWARDRVSLWNAAEAAEKRRNSRVAREFEVSLPSELNPEQRLSLARAFAREVADRYGVAVDLAIHDPKPGRESFNFHAHMLATTREISEKGLGAKAGLDMRTVARAQQGLPSHPEEYSVMRERWATLTNEAFRQANLPHRVDHRTLAAQGIDRKPLVHIPMEFYQLERQGVPKEAAERLRAEYRARIAAYRERLRGEETAIEREPSHVLEAAAGGERSAGEQVGSPRQPASAEPVRAQHVRAPAEPNRQEVRSPDEQPNQATPQPKPLPRRDAAEIRRRAVQEWLQMRSKEAQSSEVGKGLGKESANERGRGDERER